jgi:hypothetical protein
MADVRDKLQRGGISALRQSYVSKRISAAQLARLEEQLRDLLIRYGLSETRDAGIAAAQQIGARWQINPELMADIITDKENKVKLLMGATGDAIRDSLKTLIADAVQESPLPSRTELGRRIYNNWFDEKKGEHLFSPARAQRIARTELAQARGMGQATAYADIGVEEVEWLAYPNDGRSGKRMHWRMRGKRITVKAMNGKDESKWFKLPDGTRTPHPNWIGLPAGQTVNCRCNLLAVG